MSSGPITRGVERVAARFRKLGRWITELPWTPLDWIQVEVTSHCNATCIYCPLHVCHGSWNRRHMTRDTFEYLIPAFQHADMVYLQGWGEPLLNPHFFHMVRAAKKRGCAVGTTSNATLWNKEKCEKAIECGLDIVGFSLAGTDPRQDLVRGGTSLQRVLDAIRILDQAKRKSGSAHPAIHIAYMVLRSGLEDVKRLPALLEGLGVSQIVLSTLDLVPVPELLNETLRPKDSVDEEILVSLFSSVALDGKKRGMDVRFRIASSKETLNPCTENVRKACFVSADGTISPCAYANVPIGPPAPGTCSDGEDTLRRIIFGNIREQALSKIWHSEQYRSFRKYHETGAPYPGCIHCTRLLMPQR